MQTIERAERWGRESAAAVLAGSLPYRLKTLAEMRERPAFPKEQEAARLTELERGKEGWLREVSGVRPIVGILLRERAEKRGELPIWPPETERKVRAAGERLRALRAGKLQR